MASSSSNKKAKNTYKILPGNPFEEITCIETDEFNFKEVVQKFTALREEKPKPPKTHKKSPPPRADGAGKQPSGEMGARRPTFEPNNTTFLVKKTRIFGVNIEKVAVSPGSVSEVLEMQRKTCTAPMMMNRGVIIKPQPLLPLFPMHSIWDDNHEDGNEESSSSCN
ncbi:hypothetical protein ACH5RR_008218 [Cinchona calisaya]|uniref:VQ motif-containing protein n=1 Tax=Cinchona calisaya TaxID=153742 RepID=A0ABD3ADA8_9GENT